MYNPYEDYKQIRDWLEAKDKNVKKTGYCRCFKTIC